MKKILIIVGLALFMASCSTTQYTYRETEINHRSIIANDVVVDVKVDLKKKIQATSSKRNSVELAKSESYYLAINQNDIDIVVDPIFEIISSGRNYTAKLSGFAGYYTNPRNKTDAIKELKSVDTLDIHKFNNIYLGIPFPVRKTNVAVLKMGSNVNVKQSTSSDNSLISTSNFVNDTEKNKVLKSNYGFKFTSAENTFATDEFGDTKSTGFGLAFMYNSNPNDKFGLIYEIMYASVEDYSLLSVPVVAKYSLTKRISIFAGPSLTYLLDTDVDTSLSFGFDYGLAVDLGKTLFLDAKFSKGLNAVDDYSEGKVNTFNLGVGFRF